MKSFITFIVSALLIAAGEYFVKSKDLCTIIIVSIMLITIFIEAISVRRKLLNITKALNTITDKVQNKVSDYSTDCDFVNSCFKNYFDYRNSLEDHKNLVNLSDYINSDIIAKEIHKDITDQIANAMTGLGILGTFVGLSIGLQDFHTDGAQAITDSIPALLNGIKTAFYTSIGGVMISLIYTHFYQEALEENSRALDNLFDSFSSKVAQPPEIYYYNTMLMHQEKQTNSLNALAASIGDELAPRLAKEIKSSIVPTMEHLNKLITTSINNTIDDYIKEAVKTQSTTLKKIVDDFMKTLNHSLHDQFENLSHSIEHMCEYQHNYTEEIQTIVDSLKEIINHLNDLNSDITNTADISKEINQTSIELFDKIKRYVDDIRHYQDTVAEITEKNLNFVDSFTAKLSDVVNFCETTQEFLKKHEEDIKANTKITKAFVSKVENIQNSFTKQVEQSTSYIDATEQSIKLLIDKIDVFAKEASNEMKNIGNNAMTTSKHDREVIQDKMNKIINSMNDMKQSLENDSHKVSESNEKLKQAIDANRQDYTKMQCSYDELRNSNIELYKDITTGLQKISNALKSAEQNPSKKAKGNKDEVK